MDNSRTEILIGKENINKLNTKIVTIVGVGGVGGYVAVMLARAGIDNIVLIDFDKVCPSNINRQIVAYNSTIGKSKVEVLKNMIEDINPNAQVKIFDEKLTEENVEKLINKNSFVVDAIDSVKDKIALICYCKDNDIEIISAMGAGNRFDIPNFQIMDIEKTHDDGLAKVVRKKLREIGVKGLNVAISTSSAIKTDGIIGSISYYPVACACVISSYVVNKIINS